MRADVSAGSLLAGDDVRGRVYDNSGNPALLALALPGPGRALDLGCGSGANARLLRERGWEVTGVTLSPAEQEIAARHCHRVLLADLDEPLPEALGRGFELVVLSHVLEHLRHPERLLGAVSGLLAPGGTALVALPNLLFYPIRIRMAIGRFEYEQSGILDETHLRFFSFASGAALIEGSGLRVLEARADGGFPLSRIRRLLPRAAVDWIDAAACRWRPGLFGRQCLYRAIRA